MTYNAHTPLVSLKLWNKSTTNCTNEFDTLITMGLLAYNRPTETSTHNLKILCKKHDIWLLTGSIARSAKRRLFNLLKRPILRVFNCTNEGEIWHGEGDWRSPTACQFHPHWRNDKGIGRWKLKFLLIFDQNVEYKHPARSYPLRDFHKICRVCTSFQDALAVKVSLDLLNWVMELWGF